MKRACPKIGERRSRVRFAWTPLNGTDGFRYWLCRVREVHEYVRPLASSPVLYAKPLLPIGTPYAYGEWMLVSREGA